MNRKTIRILMLLLVAMGLGIGEAKSQTVQQKVEYMGWDDAQKKLVEMTTPEGVNVTVLEGTEMTLGSDGETWYIVNGTKTYEESSPLTIFGDTHIILADDADLKVKSYINISNGKLTIYSQSSRTNEGRLTVTAALDQNGFNLDAGILTVNGGNIAIFSGDVAIQANGYDVTFNGGETQIVSYLEGICAKNVIFNGGEVVVFSAEASGSSGIKADKLTLGWTNPTDYIFCSSYNNAPMETVSGKSFAVYNNDDVFMYVIGAASGKTSFSSISSLGNIIRPFEGKLVPVGSDKYYAYNLSSGNYKPLNPGVSVYLVTGIAYNQSTKQYEAVLSEAQPGVVPDVPVIFGADKLPNSIALKEDATVSLSATPSENFIACDGAKKVSELLPSGVNFADVYFFGLSGNSFKRVLLGSDDVHPAGTCFLFIAKDDFNNPPSSAPAGVRGIGIETDGTTSLIGNGQLTTDHAASAQWYSLDGRRLDKAPKTKGVYIRNGKKLVIK